MIVLTGPSGNLGGGVLRHILSKKLISPSSLIVSSYNTSSVPAEAQAAGLEVRHGDYTKPETLAAAFKDASVLFLVTYPSPSAERFEHHKAAIDAAKRAGISHVIYTSLAYGGTTGLKSVAGVMEAHINSVNYLMASGLKYTIIREGIYSESWSLYHGLVQIDKGEGDINIVLPGEGKIAWAKRDELCEATAIIIANHNDYVNKSVLLTGPQALSIRETAALIQTSTGRTVNMKIVTAEEAISYHHTHQSPPKNDFKFLKNWVTWFQGIQDGECEVVDPALEKLLGRRPTAMKDMATELFKV